MAVGECGTQGTDYRRQKEHVRGLMHVLLLLENCPVRRSTPLVPEDHRAVDREARTNARQIEQKGHRTGYRHRDQGNAARVDLRVHGNVDGSRVHGLNLIPDLRDDRRAVRGEVGRRVTAVPAIIEMVAASFSSSRPRRASATVMIKPPSTTPTSSPISARRGPRRAPTAPIILTSPAPTPPRAKGPNSTTTAAVRPLKLATSPSPPK